MPPLRFKRGALASLPTLYAGEPAITTDTGTERLYIGTSSGNVRIARYDEVVGLLGSSLQPASLTLPTGTPLSNDNGETGHIKVDGSYIYIYTGAEWARVALTTY